MLARIWNEARRQGVALPKLVCVGRWGWGVEDLRNYLNANPALNEDIKFVGAIDDNDLIDLYRSALFEVTPSLVEGWGYGASECLDFGLPVIVSTVPGLLEAVRGLMPAIDPQDQAAWYAKIRLLSENKDEIAELRNRIRSGYRPVSNSESWEAIKAALWQHSSS